MPFRSVEFGDSIINTKSVPTAQSPWWYQLKTASFRVGTSHAAAFFLFLLFSLHGKSFPWQWWPLYRRAPVPCSSPKALLPWGVGKHLAAQFLHPLASPPSGQARAMGFEYNISSCHHAGIGSIAWTAPSRKPCGVPSLLVQWLQAATTDHLMNFTVRPQLINIIFLFQSVFQVFLECHKWRAGLFTKCPVLNPIYMQKLCQLTPRLNQCKPLLWGLF